MPLPVYRIVKTALRSQAFDGMGARRFGGRWNSKSTRCVYVAQSASLAILEVLVHAGPRLLSNQYCLFEAQVPEDGVTRLRERELPGNWRANPAPPETADIGDAWLRGNQQLALALPSAVVPMEWIYLLNPGHAEFHQLAERAKQLPLQLDPRLVL